MSPNEDQDTPRVDLPQHRLRPGTALHPLPSQRSRQSATHPLPRRTKAAALTRPPPHGPQSPLPYPLSPQSPLRAATPPTRPASPASPSSPRAAPTAPAALTSLACHCKRTDTQRHHRHSNSSSSSSPTYHPHRRQQGGWRLRATGRRTWPRRRPPTAAATCLPWTLPYGRTWTWSAAAACGACCDSTETTCPRHVSAAPGGAQGWGPSRARRGGVLGWGLGMTWGRCRLCLRGPRWTGDPSFDHVRSGCVPARGMQVEASGWIAADLCLWAQQQECFGLCKGDKVQDGARRSCFRAPRGDACGLRDTQAWYRGTRHAQVRCWARRIRLVAWVHARIHVTILCCLGRMQAPLRGTCLRLIVIRVLIYCVCHCKWLRGALSFALDRAALPSLRTYA